MKKTNWQLMGKPVILEDGRFLAFGLDDSCMIKAKVKSVEDLFSERETLPDKTYRVMIETEFGDLPLYHTVNMVKEDERKYIKPGCCVYTSCCLQGDVAIGEYQKGAVFDAKHLYELMQWEIAHGDGTRLIKALSDDAKYITIKDGVMADDKDKVIAYLKDIAGKRKKKETPTYTYIGMVTGFVGEKGKEQLAAGTNIIAIAYDSPAKFGTLMTLEFNEKQKIKAINTCVNMNHSFKINIPYGIELNEYYELNVFKYCCDNQNFAACVNFFAWNANLTHEDKEVVSHVLNVLDILRKLIVAVDESGHTLNSYLIETDVDDSVPKRKGIALSQEGFERAESLIFFNLDEHNKVKEVMFKDAVNHKYSEIEGIKSFDVVHFDPENLIDDIGQSEDEWLGTLLKWSEDKDEKIAGKVWNGIAFDCTYEYIGVKTHHLLIERNDIYSALKVFANNPASMSKEIVKDKDGRNCLKIADVVIHVTVNKEGKMQDVYVTGPL